MKSDGISMSVFNGCPFHRVSEGIGMGNDPGYCDLDASQTICDGDIKFCEKPNTMEQYILVRLAEEKLQQVEKKG
jgi:hypothetical protein